MTRRGLYVFVLRVYLVGVYIYTSYLCVVLQIMSGVPALYY